MTDEQLAEIRERADAATPGPWEVHNSCSWRRIGTPSHDGAIIRPTNDRDGQPNLEASYADLDFIVKARNDVPELLDEIERLKSELADAWVQCDGQGPPAGSWGF